MERETIRIRIRGQPDQLRNVRPSTSLIGLISDPLSRLLRLPYSRRTFPVLNPLLTLVLFILRRASLSSSSCLNILLFSANSPRWASFCSEYVNPF